MDESFALDRSRLLTIVGRTYQVLQAGVTDEGNAPRGPQVVDSASAQLVVSLSLSAPTS